MQFILFDYLLLDLPMRCIGYINIAQLVEVTDSVVLGGEIVSSIPAVGHKIFFSIFRHS